MKDLLRTYGDDPRFAEGLESLLEAELEKLRLERITYGERLHAGQEYIISSSARRKIVVAANRWGKTEGQMRDVLWCARGDHPYRRVRPASQLWIAAPDFPSYLKFHKPAFDKWCPPAWIVGAFHESEKWVDIRREDGGICRLFFLSYDMGRSKFQGAGVDGIWLDEECPEDIVNECLARIVTTRGWIVLTFTPVSGVGWWYDRFWVPAIEGRSKAWFHFQAALATKDPANPDEFEVGESLVPHLTREQIVEFASDYPDPDERAIRVFGAVTGRQGLVYKGYRTAIHKIPTFTLPAHADLWGAVDPGYHGFAALIAASIWGCPASFICEEYFSSQKSTASRFTDLCDKVRALKPVAVTEGAPVVVVFFVDTEDPQVVLELNIQAAVHAENEAKEDKDPVLLSFASLDQGLKARKAGFLRVQQLLAPSRANDKPDWVNRPQHVDGEPLLYFFDSLYSEWQGQDDFHRESRVLWEIVRYSWKKPPRDSQVQPDDGDENSADGAHAMAALRYLIMARLGAIEPPKKKREKTGDAVLDAVLADMDDVEADLAHGIEREEEYVDLA